MLIPRGPAYSWKKAVMLIFFSTLFSLSLFAFLQTRGDQAVVAIIQAPHGESLPTQCLAELIGLSVDQPLSFSHFPMKAAKERLEQTACIAKASLKKIRPNILYVEYTLREPIARLGNQSNLAMDASSATFPIEPFYTPKDIPILYSDGKGHEIFLQLLDYPIKKVDLSAVDAPSLGSRQIVVEMKNGALLRLPVHNCKKTLDQYMLLAQKKDLSGHVIDLRVPNTAYIH